MADEDEIKMKVAFETKYDAALNSFSRFRSAIEKQLKNIPASVELNSTDTTAFNKSTNAIRGDLLRMDKLFQQFSNPKLNTEGQFRNLSTQFDQIFNKTKGDILNAQNKLSQMDYAGIGGATVGDDTAKARFDKINQLMFGPSVNGRGGISGQKNRLLNAAKADEFDLYDKIIAADKTGTGSKFDKLAGGGEDQLKSTDLKNDGKTRVSILDVMKKLGRAIMALIAALGALAKFYTKELGQRLSENISATGFISKAPVLAMTSNSNREIERMRYAEKIMGEGAFMKTDDYLGAVGRITDHRQTRMSGQGDIDPALAQNIQWLLSNLGDLGSKYSLADLLTKDETADGKDMSAEFIKDAMNAVEKSLPRMMESGQSNILINAMRGVLGDGLADAIIAFEQFKQTSGVNGTLYEYVQKYGAMGEGKTMITPEMQEVNVATLELKAAIDALKLTITNGLSGTVTSFVSNLTRLINWINSIIHPAKDKMNDVAAKYQDPTISILQGGALQDSLRKGDKQYKNAEKEFEKYVKTDGTESKISEKVKNYKLSGNAAKLLASTKMANYAQWSNGGWNPILEQEVFSAIANASLDMGDEYAQDAFAYFGYDDNGNLRYDSMEKMRKALTDKGEKGVENMSNAEVLIRLAQEEGLAGPNVSYKDVFKALHKEFKDGEKFALDTPDEMKDYSVYYANVLNGLAIKGLSNDKNKERIERVLANLARIIDPETTEGSFFGAKPNVKVIPKGTSGEFQVTVEYIGKPTDFGANQNEKIN